MPLEHDIVQALLPLLIILAPAFLTYEVLGGKIAFTGGALIGIAIGTSTNLLENWVIVLGVVALALVLFMESGGPEYVEEAIGNG